MIIFWLFLASLVVAVALFIFGWLWYSPAVFGKVLAKSMKSDGHENLGKALTFEFLSNFLLAAGAIFIFAPYNPLFGAINGIIISLTIILPFALSDYVWSEKNGGLALFFIKIGHKVALTAIAFTLAGVFNNFVVPYII